MTREEKKKAILALMNAGQTITYHPADIRKSLHILITGKALKELKAERKIVEHNWVTDGLHIETEYSLPRKPPTSPNLEREVISAAKALVDIWKDPNPSPFEAQKALKVLALAVDQLQDPPTDQPI